jgi:hypothetical protein
LFGGGAQHVFKHTLVGLCTGQQQQCELLVLPGLELACAQGWGLQDVAGQAVSE